MICALRLRRVCFTLFHFARFSFSICFSPHNSNIFCFKACRLSQFTVHKSNNLASILTTNVMHIFFGTQTVAKTKINSTKKHTTFCWLNNNNLICNHSIKITFRLQFLLVFIFWVGDGFGWLLFYPFLSCCAASMFMLDAIGIFLRIFSGIFSESFLGIFSGIFFYFFENILNTDILDQKERFFG